MKRMIRDVLCMSLFLVVTYSLFGMMYKSRQRVRAVESFHLVPMDQGSMHELGFCPLYSEQEFEFNAELFESLENELRTQGVAEEDIRAQLASLLPLKGLKYHMFNQEQMAFEEFLAPVDAPCVVSLGMHEEWDRYLIQYKSLDQFELAKKTSLSPALCAGHALNNAYLLYLYVTIGQIKYLMYMHDLEYSSNFLLDLNMSDWVNVGVVKDAIQKMRRTFGVKLSQMSAISSAQLFDSHLKEKSVYQLIDQQEYEYVQNLKAMIQRGLSRNENYIHIIIVGNEEAVFEHGHYFTFAICKVGTTVQYIVLDTMPNVYHLQEGSHELNRLMFMIQNLEAGESDVNLVNLQEEQLKATGAF